MMSQLNFEQIEAEYTLTDEACGFSLARVSVIGMFLQSLCSGSCGRQSMSEPQK